MSYPQLRPEEIAALRWLEKEFPISPTPRYVEWAGVVRDLSAATDLHDEKTCEALIEALRQRGYLGGGRAMSGMFTGSITVPGQDFLRRLDAEEARRKAEGSLSKRLARYVVVQSGPILVQAIVGLVIGALIGWFTSTLQSAILTGLASATVAGRMPPFRG